MIETPWIYELIGYLASLLVAVSLMMSQIVKLRIVNMIGALTFTVYGFLIGSMPVALMNAFIVCINVYYLWQMSTMATYFKLLKVGPDDGYLKYFLDHYIDDIRTFQPDAPSSLGEGSLAVFILRNLIPVGLLVGRMTAKGVFVVDLDYVIPNYRDFKTGNFIFNERLSFFRELGIDEIYTFAFKQAHVEYLLRIGFKETAEPGKFKLQVP